jgi:hypothetical protein
MTETEQQTPGPSLQPGEVAANIAKDAQENLAGLEVVSVGSMFADEMAGELYLQVYIVLPNRAGDGRGALDHSCARSRHPARAGQCHGSDHCARNPFRPRADFPRRAGIRQILPKRMAERECRSSGYEPRSQSRAKLTPLLL